MKESKEVISFIAAIAKSIAESVEDGKVSYADAVKFWTPVSMMTEAFEGADKVYTELMTLDAKGLDELVRFAKAQLDLPQDNIELIIELAIDIGAKLIKLVGIVKAN